MAWILGYVNDEEYVRAKQIDPDLRILSPIGELGLIGQNREEDDTDRMVMIWLDCDVLDLVDGVTQ